MFFRGERSGSTTGHTHPSPPNKSSALCFFPALSVVGLPACLFFRSRFAVGLDGRVHIVYNSSRVVSCFSGDTHEVIFAALIDKKKKM